MSCWHNAGVGSLDGRTASFSIAVRTSRAENENCTSPYETQRPRAEFSWDGCLEAKRGAAGAHTAARRGAARGGMLAGGGHGEVWASDSPPQQPPDYVASLATRDSRLARVATSSRTFLQNEPKSGLDRTMLELSVHMSQVQTVSVAGAEAQ
jgi:hypothetical protein